MWRGGEKDVKGKGERCGGEERRNMVKLHIHVPHRYMYPKTCVQVSTVPYTLSPSPTHTPPSPTYFHHPYTLLHHHLHTPPPFPTLTSAFTIHTSTICLPACLINRSNNYVRCLTSGPGQRPKSFAPNMIWFCAISLLHLLFYYATYQATVHF